MTTTLDSVSLQAAFQKHFNRALAEGVHDGIFGKNEKLNPKIAIDSMVKALKDVGAEQGVIDGIKDLKADDYVDKFINDFDESMKNEKIDSSNIFAKKPDFKLEEALAIAAKGEGISDLDLFLAGAEKHGKGVATRAYGAYSKYGDLKKITEPLRLEKNVNDALKYVDGIDPALKTKHYDQLYKRSNKPYTVDLGSGKKITVKPRKHEFQSAMDKVYDALDEQDNYANQLKADKASKFGKFKSKAGAIGGPLASIGGGAYGIVSSNQALVDLEQRLKDGEITQEEHDFQETQVKLGQASSGMMVATGVAQGAGEIAKKITKYSAKHGVKNIGVSGAKTAARFAPAAGDLLAMGMSAVALAQNAMSADKARREGNHGRAAMYGVMATLDSVNVVLNGVAFVCDLIPGIGNVISIGLNLAAAGLDVVKNLIGVFAEMVDTRSDDDKIQERFDAYVGSDAFKSHIDDLAASYKRAGFDVFQYEIDSDAAGIDGTEEGHKKIAAHSVLRKLTTEAKDSTNVKDLRQAIINNTGETKEYDLGKGDDLIRLLNGKGVKTVYAGEGDDELISIKGNHNLFGGLGDDLLIAHEGTGTLDGGAGDDTIIKYKGDGLINGGEGNDRAFAGWGEEKIEAGSGDDVVFGGGGDDTITGGAGKDSISGGLGDDSMEGGSGDDNYATGLGVDTISDTQGKNSVTLRALNQVEAILARESRNLNWEVKHRLKYPKFGYTVKLESDKKSSIRADIEKHRIEKQFELVRETGSGDSKYVYRETVNGIDQLFSSNSYRDKKKMGDFNLSYAHRFELDYDFLKGLSKTKLNDKLYSKGSFSEINSLVVGEDKVKQFLNSRLEVSAKSIDYGKNNVTGSSPIDETRGLYLLGDTQIKVNGKKIPAYLLSNGGNLIAVSTDGQTAFELKQSDFAFLSNHKGDQNKAAEQRYYLYLMDRVGAYTEMDKPEVFTDSVFSDTITGSDGNDKIIFGSGSRENDVVKGEKGDDKFIFDHYIRNFDTNFDYGKYRGNYTLDGGEGDDTLIIGESKVNTYAGFFDADKYIIDEQSGKVKDSDKSYVQVRDKRLEFSNIEVIYGSDKKASDGVGNRNSNDDTIVADGLNNTIYGRGGDDFLHGNGGDDYLDGGQGSDTLIGGSGNDTLISGGTNRTKIADKLFGGAGNDVLYANGAGSVYMYGGEGTDIYKIDASKEGVSATISDQDKGNALTIKGIKTTDEIQALSVRMHQNGLVIGTIQNPDLIRWNPETQFSSIEDMVTAFTDRFSGIYFEDTKHVLDKSRLNKFLTDRLMERVISREDQSTGKSKYVSRFATSVVAARDGSDLNDQIVVDLYGDNKALNAHGGDDLIVAASGFAAKGATNNISTVNTGNGSDTVVIGNVDRQININFSENNVKKNEDKNTLLVRNMDMSELSYQQKSGRHELSYRGKVVASMDVLPDNLLFNDSSAGVTWIVSDIQSYLQSPTTYKPVNFLDANQKLGMAVKMNAELDENNNVWIQVNKRSGGILEFDLTIGNASSSSGFTINSIDKPKELDIASFVKEWAVRLQGGVRLNDTHLSMTEFATKLVQGLRNLNDDATFHIVDQGVETMLKNIEALDVSNRELAGVPVINAKQSLASELSAQLVHGDNAYIRLSAKGQEIARIPTTQKDIGDIPSLIKDNIAVIRFKDGRLDGDQLAKSIDSQITYHDKYGEGSKFVPEKVISYSENIAIKDFDFSYQSSNSPWYRNDRKWREVDRIYHFVDGANGKRWVYQSLTMPKGTLTNELSREVKFDSTSDYRLTLHGEGLSAAELRKNGQSSWAKLYAGDALIGKVNLSGSAEGVPGGKFDELVNTYTLDIDGQVFRQHEGKRLKLRLESKKGNLARVHDIKLEKLVGAMASFDSRQGIALGSNSDLFGNQYTVTASPLSHAELLWSR